MKQIEEIDSSIISEILNEISPIEAEKTEKRMLLAAKIDDAVKAKSWNRTDFAREMNKEPSVITKWLSGTHNFTFDTLLDIQRILDINLINLDEKLKEQEFVQHFVVSIENKENNCTPYMQILYGEKLQTTIKTAYLLSNKTNTIQYQA